jgi:D-alanine-D-alanine ligase
MKIGVVFELQETYTPGEQAAPDDNVEMASDDEVDYIAATLESLGHQVQLIGDVEQLTRLIARGETVDLVFNYAAGRWGAAREAHVPALLEAWRIPYTGADAFSLTISLDKAMTKHIWQSVGLPTPAFVLVADLSELDDLLPELPAFPLFVKPAREGTSKGITPESLVTSESALRRQAAFLLARYHQPVLIESFLPGSEYSVGVLDSGRAARVLGVVEVRHGVKLADSAAKKSWRLQTFAAVEDAALCAQLAELALRAYRAVDCQVIGRLDIRLDAEGRPQLLEINPNPGLHPTRSIVPAMAHRAGLSYASLLAELIELAVRRWSLKRD